ncbi:MAG: hypothetical protein ACJ8GJ_00030 [Vitreoscilla sp.]
MNLYEWATGQVTRKSFAQKYLAAARAAGHADAVYDEAQFAVRFDGDDSTDVAFLASPYARYCQTGRSQRAAALREMISSRQKNKAALQGAPCGPDQLLPVIRDRSHAWFVLMQLAENIPGASFDASRQIIGQDHAVSLVQDAPTAVRHLNAKELDGLQMTFADALIQAGHNLRRMSGDRWRKIAPHVYLGDWGDGYECSRILLPDLICRLDLPGRPVALTPCDGTLLVTSDRSAEGQLAIVDAALSAMDQGPRHICDEMLVLDDGVWRTFVSDDAQVLARHHELRTRIRKGRYDQQKAMLDGRPGDIDGRPFVASYLAYKGDEGVFSVATWSEGVESWLPKTDVIVFVRSPKDGVQPELVRVGWDIAFDYLAASMIAVPDVVPERFHVLEFPSSSLLEQLSTAVQV